MPRLLVRRALANLAQLCVVLLGLPALAQAANVVVTDCSSDADLRAKVAQLQSGSGGTVKFACGANPPAILLTGGSMTLTKKTTIDGGTGITISGGNGSRHFVIAAGAKVTLRNLRLTKGFTTTDNGGSISSSGTLTIEKCRLFDNDSTVFSGGAILSLGKLTIIDSELDQNKGANGGAIYARFSAAKTTIIGSSLHDNSTTSSTDGWGGAILIWDGAEVTITSSTVSANRSTKGGAVYVFGATSKLTSSGTTWTGNVARNDSGGAIYNLGTVNVLGGDTFTGHLSAFTGGVVTNEGTLSLRGSTISGNSARFFGGGLLNNGTAEVSATTFSGNNTGDNAAKGGAIYNAGSLSLLNVTVSGNTTNGDGGGLYNADESTPTSIVNSTFLGNSADGNGNGVLADQSEIRFKNTIVAGSQSGLDCYRSLALLTSQGFNISSDGSCEFNESTDQEDTDPLLGPLAFFGGTTRTHRPQVLSPAIDNGAAAGCPMDDQRFATRPQGLGCDIGAVEVCDSGRPALFDQLAPAAGVKLTTATPTLDWEDASCTTDYKVVLRSGSSTGPVVLTKKALRASELRLPPLANGTYSWIVKACAKRCRTTGPRSFRVKVP